MTMMKVLASTLALLCLPAVASANALRADVGPYEVQVLIDGVPSQTYHHSGESYVLGSRGSHYTLRVYNRSGQRVEAVVSVDGRDVIDGRSADYQRKRGYLVAPYSQVDIDGWRISSAEVAAFRFSSVASSYAGRTGSARDVGVIGVAVFPERQEPQYPVLVPRPYPHPRRYYDDAPSASSRDEAAGRGADAAPEAKAARPASPPPPGGYGGGALADRERANQRPGLGTAFGERMDSAVQEVPFVRQNSSHPSAMLGLRYNDRAGLYAMGVDVDGRGYLHNDSDLRRTAQPFPVNRSYATPPPGWGWDY
jgi:hypothetical protein